MLLVAILVLIFCLGIIPDQVGQKERKKKEDSGQVKEGRTQVVTPLPVRIFPSFLPFLFFSFLSFSLFLFIFPFGSSLLLKSFSVCVPMMRLFVACLCVLVAVATAADSPNFILLMADDGKKQTDTEKNTTWSMA